MSDAEVGVEAEHDEMTRRPVCQAMAHTTAHAELDGLPEALRAPALTARQAEVLAFVRAYIAERSYPPTLREIGAHFGIRSTNGVSDHLRALEKKGRLRRSALKSRGLVPIELDTGVEATSRRGLDGLLRADVERSRELLRRALVAAYALPTLTANIATVLADIAEHLKVRPL